MFGLAAAIAMVAAADIESSNIVGYGQSALKSGGTAVVAQFVPCVGGTDLDLQALIGTGDEASDHIEIQTLDSYGRTVDSYS